MKVGIEVVTGFLGAGKSAFINSLIKTTKAVGEKIIVLTCEIGNVKIKEFKEKDLFVKHINFMEDNADSEIYSNELKKQAGFGKDGEKGFDGAITNLMMQTYLCNCDFKKRVNKRGIEYGWDVAVYSSIEHIYGYDYVTSCYKDNPQDSWKLLVDYMHEMFPDATDKQIRKVLK